MRKGSVFDATVADAEEVGRNLRLSDYNELRAATGKNPMDVCIQAVVQSPGRCYSWHVVGGGPICLWGVAPAPIEGVGVPWMFGTADMRHFPREVVTFGKPYTKKWNEMYPLLVNFVDVRNETSIRWIRALGYSFIKLHKEYGFAKIPFYEFVRIKHV